MRRLRGNVRLLVKSTPGPSPPATSGAKSLTFSVATRRSAPWPEFAMGALTKLANAHKGLPVPKQAGRLIGLKKK